MQPSRILVLAIVGLLNAASLRPPEISGTGTFSTVLSPHGTSSRGTFVATSTGPQGSMKFRFSQKTKYGRICDFWNVTEKQRNPLFQVYTNADVVIATAGPVVNGDVIYYMCEVIPWQ